jgi:hypothetical protein
VSLLSSRTGVLVFIAFGLGLLNGCAEGQHTKCELPPATKPEGLNIPDQIVDFELNFDLIFRYESEDRATSAYDAVTRAVFESSALRAEFGSVRVAPAGSYLVVEFLTVERLRESACVILDTVRNLSSPVQEQMVDVGR